MSADIIKKFEQRISDLESKIKSGKSDKSDKSDKPPKLSRKPSEYNIFMGKYIKDNKNQNKPHKELFTEAVKEWNKIKK